MTALQILEKIGANASFKTQNLSHDENKAVEDIINQTKDFNAILNISFPTPEDEDKKEEEDQTKN